MTYDPKEKTITMNTINNKIIKMKRFYVKSLDGTLGVWIKDNISIEGVYDSLFIKKVEDSKNKFLFQSVYRYQRSYGPDKGKTLRDEKKFNIILKDGICFLEGALSWSDPIQIKVEKDSLFFRDNAYYRKK